MLRDACDICFFGHATFVPLHLFSPAIIFIVFLAYSPPLFCIITAWFVFVAFISFDIFSTYFGKRLPRFLPCSNASLMFSNHLHYSVLSFLVFCFPTFLFAAYLYFSTCLLFSHHFVCISVDAQSTYHPGASNPPNQFQVIRSVGQASDWSAAGSVSFNNWNSQSQIWLNVQPVLLLSFNEPSETRFSLVSFAYVAHQLRQCRSL